MCEPVCGRAEVVMSLGCGNGLGVWDCWMRVGLIGEAEEEGKESVSAVWLMMRARRRGGGMVRLVVVEGK